LPLDQSAIGDVLSSGNVPGFGVAASCEHFVQFYEHDASLVASIADFVGDALASDASAIVVATPAHLHELEQRLSERGVNVVMARHGMRLVALDAEETLESLLIDGVPDKDRFAAVIESRVAEAARRASRVVIFGEMVALLWDGGHHDEAVQLEALWNELAQKYDFSLFCAYPVAGMASGSLEAIHAVCGAHSHAMPANVIAHASEERRLAEICDLKRLGRALDLERALLAAIVESSDDAIISKSLDGRITSWNAGAKRLFGYSAEEAIGRPITMIIPPEHLHEEQVILQRLARGERIDHFETVRVAKDGRRIDVSLTISPVRDREGRVVGASKVARDITERKRMEAQLRDADRRKDEFIAMLGHELRNPLAPIRNVAEVLKRTTAGNETSAELCRMIERQVQQMTRLIDDLLDVSRITRGRIRFRREPVDLADVVKRAVEMTEPLLRRRRHRFQIDLPGGPLPLEGDAARLVQMVVNLLDNAAKYTPDGGSVALSVARTGSRFELCVRDSGIGIAPEMVSKIFGLFVQGARPGTDAQGGLGIGLALVRMIAEHHGGAVEASSAGAGKGSAFVVRLPAAAVESASHHPFG
jgi:PAS domain S-box-containing protein